MTMETMKPLRFGVLGAAKIARSFIAGVGPSELVDVAAVASRDLEKGRQFASEVGMQRAHGSYEALIHDADVDAIYVPLPNTLHAEWVIKALDAGKHVLCEKPIAVSKADTLAMFETVRRNHRFLASSIVAAIYMKSDAAVIAVLSLAFFGQGMGGLG